MGRKTSLGSYENANQHTSFTKWLQYVPQGLKFKPVTICPIFRCRKHSTSMEITLFTADRALNGWNNTMHRPLCLVMISALPQGIKLSNSDEKHKKKPDMRAAGAADGFDISFVSPMQPFHLRMITFNTLTNLNASHPISYVNNKIFVVGLPASKWIASVPIFTLER